ncbi:MAG: hypothetical protein IJV82_06325 [Oscillospiraceae bacterium]|nr:hypothetical protein [Oscillospiraceae bacterium]
MKKLILALLCLILALGLCACGDDPAPESNSKPENEQTTAPTETTEATEATEPLPEISLNEYVICEDQGFENYGSLSVYLDYARLIDDHSDKLKTNLDASYFGDKTPKEAATYIFSDMEPYQLAYEASDTLRTGDTVDVSWNTDSYGIDSLSMVMEASFTYENFTHTVDQLKPLREVDPFENVSYTIYSPSGVGSMGFPNSLPGSATVELEDNTLHWDVHFENATQGLSNGDVRHAKLEDVGSAESLARDYGIILTRTEADIEINGMPYHAQQNPREILQYYGGKAQEAADATMVSWTQDWMDDPSSANITYVGAMYLYNDEVDFSSHSGNDYYGNNALVLFYHITTELNPEGWYTYLVTFRDVVVDFEEPMNVNSQKIVRMYMNDCYRTDLLGYYYETYHNSEGYPTYYQLGDLYYIGHPSMEECVEAVRINYFEGRRQSMDHLIADEVMQEYVEEY